MKIAYVLPRGMSFSNKNATSIDLIVRDQVKNSRFSDSSIVIGPAISDSFQGINYKGVAGTSQKQFNLGFLEQVRAELPKIVVVHQYPQTASFLAKKLPNVPIVLYRHGLLRPRTGWISRLTKSMQLNPITAFIFVSHFIESEFLIDYPNLKNKCVVINNAIDTNYWHPIVQKENRICFAGRAREDKGILELIQGFKNLPQNSWDLDLILAVTNDLEAEFFNHVNQVIGTGNNINLCSNLSSNQVRDVFARSKIAALPSIVSEGFPRAVVEAMSSGCATIASRRGGTSEAVGSVGILLDEVSPSSISDSLECLIGNPGKLKKYCTESRKHAVENLDIRIQIRRLDDFLEQTAKD